MTNSRRYLLRVSLMIVARSLTTVWSRGDAYHVHLRDSLALFVHLTCLLLFHSHHWPIPQSLPSKYVQNQMPNRHVQQFHNFNCAVIGWGGPLICQGGPRPPTWSRHCPLHNFYIVLDIVSALLVTDVLHDVCSLMLYVCFIKLHVWLIVSV